MGYNPAIDAFNAAMEAGARRRQQDTDLEASRQRLDEARLGQSSRVSRLASDARIANTAADVAEGTKGADIAIKYNTATQGDLNNQDLAVELGEKRATSAPRVASQNATFEATREQAPIGTERTRLEQSERAQTSAGRVRSTNATNTNTAQDADLKFEKDIIKLYDEGRSAEAEDLARRYGKTIPDAVKNDAALRNTIKRAYEDAERWYPDMPARQKQHVQTIIQETQRRGPTNATPVSPRFDALPGLPQPQETKTNSKTQTALQQNVDFLKSRGIAKDDNDAFRLLNQSKSDPTQLFKDLYQAEYKARLDAKKGPGGFGGLDNTKMAEADAEALAATKAKLKSIKDAATQLGDTPLPSGAQAVAGAPAPAPATTPAPAPAAPAKPAPEPERPWFWQRWFGSSEPAAPVAPGTPQPSASGGGAIDARSLQGAPPKVQDRLPSAAPTVPPPPAPTIDELRTKAQNFDPQAIRERARQKIANGEDRDGVLQRLRDLGVDVSGL